MTHADLVAVAGRWLRNTRRCRSVLMERGQVHEIPDAIGWLGTGYSVLVECKASRADFRADAQKPSRRCGSGMGAERWYLAPAGVLDVSEVPEAWGLLEWDGRVVRRRKKPVPVALAQCETCGRLRRELSLVVGELNIYHVQGVRYVKVGTPAKVEAP